MSCLIAELHRSETPFAVIISNEITGKLFTILYHDRLIRYEQMNGAEINYFLNIRKQMILINFENFGSVWEFQNFRGKMAYTLKHNFLVRNQIIKNGFI